MEDKTESKQEGSICKGTGVCLVVQMVKSLRAMQEAPVPSLGQEDSLEEGMATHCSTLTWRMPRTEEPGSLKSLGSQRVGQEGSTEVWVQSLTRPGALTAGCVQVIFLGDRRYTRSYRQAPGLGDGQATPSSKPRPSGLLLLPPGPPLLLRTQEPRECLQLKGRQGWKGPLRFAHTELET